MKPIPDPGFLRLRQVLALIPVAKSTWLSGVKSGRFPKPSKALGEHITVWKYEDIRGLIDNAGNGIGTSCNTSKENRT